jgi:hypothetical protein
MSDMLNELEAKIKLMWFSLDAFNEPYGVSSVVPYHVVTPSSSSAWVDFTTALSSEKLDYVAAGLVNNIACIKDHLKNWCMKNSKKFEGMISLTIILMSRLFTISGILVNMLNSTNHLDLDTFPKLKTYERL